MRLAVAAAGFSPGKADQLRRAMGHKRSRERMAELYDDLVAGMAENGIPTEVGDQVWKQLSAFADYGFPESHAASFALLVYASAFLKLYYPAEFFCAILNNQPMGFYPPGRTGWRRAATRGEDAVGGRVAEPGGVYGRGGWGLGVGGWGWRARDERARERGSESNGMHALGERERGAVRLGFKYVNGLGEMACAGLEEVSRGARPCAQPGCPTAPDETDPVRRHPVGARPCAPTEGCGLECVDHSPARSTATSATSATARGWIGGRSSG